MEQQGEVNRMHFTRRGSCDQAVVLDCSQLKSVNAGLKRSMSAPSLTKLSSTYCYRKRFVACSLTHRGVHCNDPF